MLVPLMNATFIPGLTPRAGRETTRKLILAAAAALALAGCATPGPLHVYAVNDARGARDIADFGEGQSATVPAFLARDDTLLGFAYDPFTDHFFLRLAPGNRIRVVDRPARAVKREFTIEGLGGGGDIAVRPRDGHLFFLEAGSAHLVETTRLGKLVRRLTLPSIAEAGGLALDPVRERLLVLHADGRRVSLCDFSGHEQRAIMLDRPAGPALAIDAERGELHAPLRAAGNRIGVFDLQGRLLRELPLAAAFVDVGPRSFLRVF